MRPKAELVRLVAPEGRVVVDRDATQPGRGAYVCGAACAQRAIDRRALARAFRGAIEYAPDFVDSLGPHGEEAHP